MIVIHGVGNQTRGATTDLVARRLAETLAEVGVTTRSEDTPPASDVPAATELFIGSSRPVLVAEGYWADLIRQRRGKKLRSFLQRVWFGIPVLPFLFSAALAPRAHESALFSEPQKKSWKSLFSFRDEWAFARRAWPTLWRCITMIAVVLLAIAGVKWLGLLATLAVLGALAIASWFLLRGRWDVLEHLRVAGLETETLALIEDRLVGSIDHLAAQCDEIWIVGHSQGGYLAHRLLTGPHRNRWSNVTKYTGLASGMRPIRLISIYREWRWTVSGWLNLIGGALVMIGTWVASEPGGLLSSDGWRQTVGAQLLIIARPDIFMLGELPELAMNDIIPTDWSSVPFFLAGIVFVACGLTIGAKARSTNPTLLALPSRVEWEELASPSDLVGSMSIPEVPSSANFRVVPSLRQPLADHFMSAYFSRLSIFRFEAARWLTGSDRSRAAFANLQEAEHALRDLTDRTYRLRFGIQMALIVPAVALPVALGASLFGLATSYLKIGLIVAGVVACVAAFWWFGSARRIVTRFVEASIVKEFKFLPPRRRPTWAVMVGAFAGLLSALSAFSLTLYGQLLVAHGEADQTGALVQGLGSAGTRLMSVAVLSFLAVSFAAAQVRGVRALLFFALVWAGSALGILDQIGRPWVDAWMPGLMPTAAIELLLLLGIVFCWRRRPVGLVPSQSAETVN
ncbi:hypothetical protein [Leucobacter iarius]|uniref:Uncharacterized protein n=1 Tax=Leucobacter iarius TaxID=333963 RepID=A0ABN2L7K4_9MICO